ncbi:MAG: hypothetical protein JWP24_450 [Marmoricola sp.]|nr:hypothetical protein [Marmoricola sp.]
MRNPKRKAGLVAATAVIAAFGLGGMSNAQASSGPMTTRTSEHSSSEHHHGDNSGEHHHGDNSGEHHHGDNSGEHHHGDNSGEHHKDWQKA